MTPGISVLHPTVLKQPLHTKVYAHDSDCMLPPDFLESSYVKIHYLHDKK